MNILYSDISTTLTLNPERSMLTKIRTFFNSPEVINKVEDMKIAIVSMSILTIFAVMFVVPWLYGIVRLYLRLF